METTSVKCLMSLMLIFSALVPWARAQEGAAAAKGCDAMPRGGTLRFSVRVAGRYRIALTSHHWIDVIDGGKAMDSVDHQGARDCELVHKIVEFELRSGTPLVLQLSGSADQVVGLAITPAAG